MFYDAEVNHVKLIQLLFINYSVEWDNIELNVDTKSDTVHLNDDL